MLKTLRKKGVAKKILWVIAVVIIISFGFFGRSSNLYRSEGIPSYAGRIFGKKISVEDFQKVYRDVDLFARLHHGSNYYEIQQYLNLEADTWDRLILLHEADKRKIKITDAQVADSIAKYPFFQRDGQFDDVLYNTILKSNFLRIQPRDFEEAIRDDLKIGELLSQELKSLKLTDEEIFAYYRKLNEKVQVSFAFIAPESFKNQSPAVAEDQTSKYYEDHKLDFLVPPSIKTSYLEFDLPQTDDASKKDAVRQEAIGIYAELQANPNLEEVAGKHSLTVKTSGYFSKESPDLSLGWSFEVLNKVLSLDTNKISEPLENGNKMLIVKVIEKKDARVPAYEEIKDKVKESLVLDEAKKIAQQKAQEYLKTIKEQSANATAPDFSQIIKNLGLESYQTPLFTRGMYLPKVGLSQEFQEAAFGLSENNKISDIVETAKGFCILHFDNYQEASREDFLKQKEEIAKKISDERSGEIYQELLAKLRIEANLVDNIPKKQNQQNPAQ